jgi:hypothetical protein
MLVVGDAVKGDGRAPRASEARHQKEQKNRIEAASCYLAAKKAGKIWNPEEDGFEISIREILKILAENPGVFGMPQPPNASQTAHEGTF